MKKIFPIVITAILIIVGGLYFTLCKSSIETQPSTQTQNPTNQLEKDLSVVNKSQFINKNQVLTPELQKIQDDVIAYLTTSGSSGADYYSRLSITAIGKRYILVSLPSAASSFDEIIDSQTGKVSYIPNGASYIGYNLVFEGGRDAMLYIGGNDMFTYTLDQPEFILVPNSKLLKGETYHSGESDFGLTVHETHTESSVTIAVYDESTQVHNPLATAGAMDTMNKELRKETLHF